GSDVCSSDLPSYIRSSHRALGSVCGPSRTSCTPGPSCSGRLRPQRSCPSCRSPLARSACAYRPDDLRSSSTGFLLLYSRLTPGSLAQDRFDPCDVFACLTKLADVFELTHVVLHSAAEHLTPRHVAQLP